VAVLEVAQATLEGRDEETLLALIVERARALVDADLSAIAFIDPADGSIDVRMADGPRAAAIRGLRIPAVGASVSRSLESGRPVAFSASDGIAPEYRQYLAPAGLEHLRDLRGYIFGLRPVLASERDLTRAFQELANQLERQHGVVCAVDVDRAVAARAAGEGWGLRNLAERAAAMGGSLEIGSVLSEGTTVTFRIPLDAA
jgi:GAF domain-containing protein